jgi:hypothetical protein
VPYEYEWAPLLPPDENDPIKRIEAQLLALEAPKGDAPHAPAPAAAPAAGKGRGK